MVAKVAWDAPCHYVDATALPYADLCGGFSLGCISTPIISVTRSQNILSIHPATVVYARIINVRVVVKRGLELGSMNSFVIRAACALNPIQATAYEMFTSRGDVILFA